MSETTERNLFSAATGQTRNAYPVNEATVRQLVAERDALKAEFTQTLALSDSEISRFCAANIKLRTALHETREALMDTLDLATKAAVCETEAIVSTEPGSTIFGCAGISEKAKVARARAAWKALDDRVKTVLARYADLAGEEKGTQNETTN